MMIVKPVTLTGHHVCLEPIHESHIPELIKAGSDKSIWQISWPENQHHPDIMEQYIRDMLEQHTLGIRIHFAVRHIQSTRLIGMTSYNHFEKSHYGLEIGGSWYIIEFQQTAVNTECKYLLLKHAFEEFHCIRVQFRTEENNTAQLWLSNV